MIQTLSKKAHLKPLSIFKRFKMCKFVNISGSILFTITLLSHTNYIYEKVQVYTHIPTVQGPEDDKCAETCHQAVKTGQNVCCITTHIYIFTNMEVYMK
jgi:hypothetical protein